MVRICSWCQDAGIEHVMGLKEPLDDPSITHGICSRHAAALRGFVQALRTPGVTVACEMCDWRQGPMPMGHGYAAMEQHQQACRTHEPYLVRSPREEDA